LPTLLTIPNEALDPFHGLGCFVTGCATAPAEARLKAIADNSMRVMMMPSIKKFHAIVLTCLAQ
jgi:hypothetical protein